MIARPKLIQNIQKKKQNRERKRDNWTVVDSPEVSPELNFLNNHAETETGEGVFEDNTGEKWEGFGFRREEEEI